MYEIFENARDGKEERERFSLIEKSAFSWRQFATVREKSNVRNNIVVI